ncbi:MAG: hypothetical protein ACR2IE_01850 [Candidatus Sumerlaeaceae bacterium]
MIEQQPMSDPLPPSTSEREHARRSHNTAIRPWPIAWLIIGSVFLIPAVFLAIRYMPLLSMSERAREVRAIAHTGAAFSAIEPRIQKLGLTYGILHTRPDRCYQVGPLKPEESQRYIADAYRFKHVKGMTNWLAQNVEQRFYAHTTYLTLDSSGTIVHVVTGEP